MYKGHGREASASKYQSCWNSNLVKIKSQGIFRPCHVAVKPTGSRNLLGFHISIAHLQAHLKYGGPPGGPTTLGHTDRKYLKLTIYSYLTPELNNLIPIIYLENCKLHVRL